MLEAIRRADLLCPKMWGACCYLPAACERAVDALRSRQASDRPPDSAGIADADSQVAFLRRADSLSRQPPLFSLPFVSPLRRRDRKSIRSADPVIFALRFLV